MQQQRGFSLIEIMVVVVILGILASLIVPKIIDRPNDARIVKAKHDVLGIQAGDTNVHAGTLDTSRYPDVARQVVDQFPNVSKVAITLRESLSASHNNWGAMLYEAKSDTPCFAPLDAEGKYQSYQIKNIVDRVGGGDSFAGGLIFALTTPELSDAPTAIKYAVAASCLKHSIKGDFNFSTRQEVEALMGGSASGRVVR